MSHVILLLSVLFILLSVPSVSTRMCDKSDYFKDEDLCIWIMELSTEKNFDDAMAECTTRGGKPAILDVKEKYDIALRLIKIHLDAWVGLQDRQQEGTYVWIADDRPKLNVSLPWVVMENENIFYDCLKLTTSGSFVSKDCTSIMSHMVCGVTGNACIDRASYCVKGERLCNVADVMSTCRKTCEMCQYDLCNKNNGLCQYECITTGKNKRVCKCPPQHGFFFVNDTHCHRNLCIENNGGCKKDCEYVSNGVRKCTCPPDFVLFNETECMKLTCKKNNGGCEHTCNEKDGKIQCSCQKGYVLSDRAVCKAEMTTLETVTLYIIPLLILGCAIFAISVHIKKKRDESATSSVYQVSEDITSAENSEEKEKSEKVEKTDNDTVEEKQMDP